MRINRNINRVRSPVQGTGHEQEVAGDLLCGELRPRGAVQGDAAGRDKAADQAAAGDLRAEVGLHQGTPGVCEHEVPGGEV